MSSQNLFAPEEDAGSRMGNSSSLATEDVFSGMGNSTSLPTHQGTKAAGSFHPMGSSAGAVEVKVAPQGVAGKLASKLAETAAVKRLLAQRRRAKDATRWTAKKMMLAVGLLMAVWSWLESWRTMLFKVRNLWISGYENVDIQDLGPLTVLLLSLVMTNVLGYQACMKDGLLLEAQLAAFDLDTPYIASTRALRILRGEEVLEWHNLRLRTALWRAIPLASLKLYFAFRSFIEMPFCQATGTLDALSFEFHGDADGPFMRALNNSKPPINVSELAMFADVHERIAGKYHQSLQVDWDQWRRMTAGVWHAAHCSSSTWVRTTKHKIVDGVENWWLHQPLVTSNWGNSGEWGSGNLFMANMVFYNVVWDDLAHSDEARSSFDNLLYKKSSILYASISAFESGTIVQDSLSAARQSRRDERSDSRLEVQSFEQQRGRLGIIKFRDILVAVALVLSAILPVAKHVQMARSVRVMHQRSFIACHFTLDITLLTSALCISLAGPLAESLGPVVQKVSGVVVGAVIKIMNGVDPNSLPNFADGRQILEKLSEIFVPQILRAVEEEFPSMYEVFTRVLIPALMLSPVIFLTAAVFSAAFLAISIFLAWFLPPQHVEVPAETLVSVGIAGPLYWLASVDSSAVVEVGPAVVKMILLRSVMLSAGIVGAWWRVGAYGKDFVYALAFDSQLDQEQLVYLWLVLVCCHGFSGYLAVQAMCDPDLPEESDSDEDDEERQKMPLLTSSGSPVPRQGIYPTRPPGVVYGSASASK